MDLGAPVSERGTCNTCRGTFWIVKPGFATGDEVRDLCAPKAPCSACLHVPATDEVKRVALEWLEFDLWNVDVMVKESGHPWFRYLPGAPGGWRRVVPFYLPAGHDLGVRVLAEWWGATGKTLFVPCTSDRRTKRWALVTASSSSHLAVTARVIVVFSSQGNEWRGVEQHSGRFPVRVPALADIPTDLPPDLSAAASLVAVWKAVGDNR